MLSRKCTRYVYVPQPLRQASESSDLSPFVSGQFISNDVLTADLGRKFWDRTQDKAICKSHFLLCCCRSGHTNSLQCNALSGGQWLHAMAGRYEDGGAVARRHPSGVQEKGT